MTSARVAPTRRRAITLSVSVLAAGAISLLAFAGFSFWWTSQPSFCARCHVMDPFIEAWEESPHREVNCESCHLRPGFFGFVGGKIASLQVVMNFLRGNYEDYSFSAAVPNASCLQCHEPVLERNVHSDGILVSHRNIIEMGGKCVGCHSTVGHGDAVPVGSRTVPDMSTCLSCHNDEIAPLECGLCHVDRPPTEGAPHTGNTG